MKTTLVLALATAVTATVYQAANVQDFGATLDRSVSEHAEALDGFVRANVLNLVEPAPAPAPAGAARRGFAGRRQAVPDDATPDPDRNVTTPENIFVLQCDTAGFQGECLVFGAKPGKCGMYIPLFSSD